MLYDILRLDHFRGFDEYFEIPAEDETAVNGEWSKVQEWISLSNEERTW